MRYREILWVPRGRGADENHDGTREQQRSGKAMQASEASIRVQQSSGKSRRIEDGSMTAEREIQSTRAVSDVYRSHIIPEASQAEALRRCRSRRSSGCPPHTSPRT